MRMGEVPQEYELSNDPITRLATVTTMAYWIAYGTVFYVAWGKSDPEDFINSGVLNRYPAMGVLVGSGLLLLSSSLVWLYKWCGQKITSHKEGLVIDPEEYASLESSAEDSANQYFSSQFAYKRIRYTPSTSKFFPWELRTLLASQAVAILGAVIQANSGSVLIRANGDMIGRGIGSVAGAIIGFFCIPSLFRWINKCCGDRKTETIYEKKWYKESRHDVPFYIRIFFGAWAGYIAASVLSTKDIYSDAFNRERLYATVSGAIAAFLSPFFFAVYNALCSLRKKQEMEKYTKPHWFLGTRMDIPWYVRVFSALVTAATIALVNMNYHQRTQVSSSLIYSLMAFAFFSPFLLQMPEKFVRYCAALPASLVKPAMLNLSFDMPWYGRDAFSSVAGSMLGDVLFYLTANPNRMNLKPSVIPLITMWTTFGLAMLSPLLMAGASWLGFENKYFNSTKDDKINKSWPWYARLLLGLWSGALIGGSICEVFMDTSNINIIPGYIGPEFFQVNNQYGAPTGALIGGGVALLWPLAQYALGKVKKSQCCKNNKTVRIDKDHPEYPKFFEETSKKEKARSREVITRKASYGASDIVTP